MHFKWPPYIFIPELYICFNLISLFSILTEQNKPESNIWGASHQKHIPHETNTHAHFTIILSSRVDKEQFFQTLQQNMTHSHLLVGHSDQTVTLDSWRVSYLCENNTRPRPIRQISTLTPPTHSNSQMRFSHVNPHEVTADTSCFNVMS